MSTVAKLSGADFDSMVARGAFEDLPPMKIELLDGELSFMNPAGPYHDDYIDYLTRWSTNAMSADRAVVRVQSGFHCGEHRPEPDILWLRPRRYIPRKPTAADVLLLIEVSECSKTIDLRRKRTLYAEHDIPEYWVVDVAAQRLHRFTDPANGDYRRSEIFQPPDRPSPQANPAAPLDLAELFIEPPAEDAV